jgi:micrococcal nuclease
MITLINRCLYRNVAFPWRSGLLCFLGLLLLGLMGLMLSGCQAQSLSPVSEVGYRMSVQEVINGNTLEAIGVERIGKVSEDSETIAGADWKGKRLRIRLIGVDAPDRAQRPWGEAARQFLAEQVGFGPNSGQGQDDRLVLVSLDTQVQDSYDRVLGYVWTEAGLVNEAIVAAGHGLARSYFPNVKYEAVLADAQAEARLLGRGIWNPEQPLRESPADFRRRK